jgi:hypothetical protein
MKSRNLALLACILILGCVADSSDGTDSSLSGTATSDTLSLVVLGASKNSCTIYGDENAVLGSGLPSMITYTFNTEGSAIVTCGEFSAIFSVGDDSVTLSDESTAIAKLVSGSSMRAGTSLIAEAMAELDADTDSGESVRQSLADFVIALDDLQSDSESTSSSLQAVSLASVSKAKKVIKTLINMGQPVVVERVGKKETVKSCTTKDVGTFSKEAIGTDAQAAVGIDGCLAYHSLYAFTDKNNPLFTPDNLPASFRKVAKESGVVSAMVEADTTERSYTLESVHDYIFSKLGHTVYCEDDEGVVTTESLSAADIKTFLTTLVGRIRNENLKLADFEDYKFHTGYNPSGGWEINLCSPLQDEFILACVDSDPSTTCSITPNHYDFDGTTATLNSSGNYCLEMEYRDGAFVDHAWVINCSTGAPYRDSNYQRVKVTIDNSTCAPFDNTNPYHKAALDPMCDENGSCAPYSNSDWTVLYPDMTNVDNTFLFASPEVVVRLVLILDGITNLDKLDYLEAFAVANLITGSMAAFPQAANNGCHAIFQDHGKTLDQWDSITTTWLESGTPNVEWSGKGGFTLNSNGTITIGTKKCTVKPKGASKESCTITGSALLIDLNSGSSVDNGTEYTLSGTISLSSTNYGPTTITPTKLLVSTNQKKITFTGDDNLKFEVKGKSLKDKIDNGIKITGTHSLKYKTD